MRSLKVSADHCLWVRFSVFFPSCEWGLCVSSENSKKHRFFPPAAEKLWWDLWRGGKRVAFLLWICHVQQSHLNTRLTFTAQTASISILPTTRATSQTLELPTVFVHKKRVRNNFYLGRAEPSDEWISNSCILYNPQETKYGMLLFYRLGISQKDELLLPLLSVADIIPTPSFLP